MGAEASLKALRREEQRLRMATGMSGKVKYILMVEDDPSSSVDMIMFKDIKEGDRQVRQNICCH